MRWIEVRFPSNHPNLGPRQAQPRFVNQRRRLKRLSRRLVRHPNGRQLSQFLIDQRQQLLGSLGIAPLNAVEKVGHVAHALIRNSGRKRVQTANRLDSRWIRLGVQ